MKQKTKFLYKQMISDAQKEPHLVIRGLFTAWEMWIFLKTSKTKQFYRGTAARLV